MWHTNPKRKRGFRNLKLLQTDLRPFRFERGLVQEAIRRAGDYLTRVDGMYGATAQARAVATIHDAQPFAPLAPVSLDGAITTALGTIWSQA